MNKNILIVGVGGQGSLLASRIVGNAAMEKGYDVKVSEVHGMSQRGGSVVTYVRYNDKKVYSPVIGKGEADIILSFEILEAARHIESLKKDGVLVVNTQEINPMPVVMGACDYPESIEDKLKATGAKVVAVDAISLAREAGNEKATNVVLIGAMTKHCGFDRDEMRKCVENSVPEKLREINLKAFDLGYNA